MKKAFIKLLKVILSLICISIAIGYLYFIKIPSNRAESIANQFEVAVRKNDKVIINKIITQTCSYRKIIDDNQMFQKLQQLFGRFHGGVDVYMGYYQPGCYREDGLGRILAHGRMRAKKDNNYREYFELSLVEENNEWKISYFCFPGFIDY